MKAKIILFSGKRPISYLIRLATWSKWSHAGILFYDDKNAYVYEALSQGFVKNDYDLSWVISQHIAGNIEVLEPVKKVSPECLEKACKSYLGKGYGFFDIFQIAIDIIYHKFTNKNLYLFDSSKYLICSEAVARALYDSSNHKINFSEEYHKPYSYITPKDISESKYLIKTTL